MAITGIQTITNLTNHDISFLNTEYSGNNRTIKPQWTVDVGNAWVPWCDSKDQFPAHHMEISDSRNKKVFVYIWQHRDQADADWVRYSSDGFDTPGKELFTTDVKCNLTVLEDGTVVATYV